MIHACVRKLVEMYYCEGQGKSALLLRAVENRVKAVRP